MHKQDDVWGKTLRTGLWFARADAQAPLTGRQRAALFGGMNEEGKSCFIDDLRSVQIWRSWYRHTTLQGPSRCRCFQAASHQYVCQHKRILWAAGLPTLIFLPPSVIIDPRAQEVVRTSHSNANTDILLSTWGIIDWMLLHTMGQGIWLAQCNWGLWWLLWCPYQSSVILLQLLIKAFILP